jgi:hypothetical protein
MGTIAMLEIAGYIGAALIMACAILLFLNYLCRVTESQCGQKCKRGSARPQRVADIRHRADNSRREEV